MDILKRKARKELKEFTKIIAGVPELMDTETYTVEIFTTGGQQATINGVSRRGLLAIQNCFRKGKGMLTHKINGKDLMIDMSKVTSVYAIYEED